MQVFQADGQLTATVSFVKKCLACQKAHVPGNSVWASANMFLHIHTLYVVTLVQADRGKLR